MCTHGRFIYNPYSRQKVFVRCGKCASCQQENALKRTLRIRSHKRLGYICLFVTLTYDNAFVPYVLRDDLRSSDLSLNVYRNNTGRFVYCRHSGLSFKRSPGVSVVGTHFIPDRLTDSEVSNLKHLRGLSSDKIGVCYYPDFQDFLKRFRINYEREYNKKLSFDYFAVAEYGGFSQRPHFHALLFVPSVSEAEVRASILKAWPYADRSRTAEYIEVARDCASYVASYVNCSNSSAACLKDTPFRQKHSFSKNLGILLDCFDISEILEKVRSRDLHVYCQSQFDGESSTTPVLLPKYVINRWFPQFTGMRWLTGFSLRRLLVTPQNIFEYLGNYDVDYRINVFGNRHIVIHDVVDRGFPNPNYRFSRADLYNIGVRLLNAQLRFIESTGLTAEDFAIAYEEIWNLYNSTLLKDSLTSVECFDDFSDFYFNSNDVIHDVLHSPTLDGVNLVSNPNTFRDLVAKSANLEHVYHLKDKTKKVVNYAMSNLNLNV